MKAYALRGFTLLELAVVLAIIGLIVGGILMGRDLIAAAAARAAIGQIEGYNSAVHTFKSKYGGIPGDLNSMLANKFGFADRIGVPGFGNGDGYLGSDGTYSITFFQAFAMEGGPDRNEAPEPKLFWADLSAAKLINGSFNASTTCNAWGSSAGVSLCLPTSRIGRASYVYVWPYDGNNFFGISGIAGNEADEYTPAAFPPVLTVQEAYSIDTKIDDGLPETGTVLAARLEYVPLSGLVTSPILNPWIQGDNGPSDNSGISPSATSCYDVRNGIKQYSIEMNNGSSLNCLLAFQFQ